MSIHFGYGILDAQILSSTIEVSDMALKLFNLFFIFFYIFFKRSDFRVLYKKLWPARELDVKIPTSITDSEQDLVFWQPKAFDRGNISKQISIWNLQIGKASQFLKVVEKYIIFNLAAIALVFV